MDLEDFSGNAQPTQGFLSNYNNRAPEPFGMNYNSMNPYIQQNQNSFPTFQQPFNNEMNHNSMFEFPQNNFGYQNNQSFGQQQHFQMENNNNFSFGQNMFNNNNNPQDMFINQNMGQVNVPVREDEHEEDGDGEFKPNDVVESESDDNEEHEEDYEDEPDQGI